MPIKIAALARPEFLRQRYVIEHHTLDEIAVEAGCSVAGVIKAMARHGIERRAPEESRAVRGTKRTRIFPLLNDVEWLRARYETDRLSIAKIAELVGCQTVPVQRALHMHGIAVRKAGTIRSDHPRPDTIKELRDDAWMRREYIENDRKTKDIALMLGCSPMTVATRLSDAGVRKHEPRPINWEQEPRRRTKRKGGYTMIWAPTHPAAQGSGYVSEHRIVAEGVLGRLLTKDETVHHLNLQRADNRIENLIVFPTHGAHMAFHHNPPDWVPRCPCCGKPNPEVLTGRPEGIPLLWGG